MAKVFIALPAFGRQNTSPTTVSIAYAAATLAANGHGIAIGDMSHPHIAELRGMFLTYWMDCTNCSHILFVDADMEFPPQLIVDMLALDEPLVGCIYPKKSDSAPYVGKPCDNPEHRDGFYTYDGIGFGVALIRRDCVEAILAKFPDIADPAYLENHNCKDKILGWGCKRFINAFEEIPVGKGRLSEDYSFCQRYRDAGGKVWAATHHEIGHMGPNMWRGRYADVLEAGSKR